MNDRPLTNIDFGISTNSFILYVNRTGIYFDKNGNQQDVGLSKNTKENIDNVIHILDHCSSFYICKSGEWFEQIKRQDIKDLLGYSKY